VGHLATTSAGGRPKRLTRPSGTQEQNRSRKYTTGHHLTHTDPNRRQDSLLQSMQPSSSRRIRAITRIDRLLVLSGVRCGHVFWAFWLFRGTYRMPMPSTSVRIRYASCSLLNLTSSLTSVVTCGPSKDRSSPSRPISLRWQYSRCVLSTSRVCPDLDLEVGDSGSWDLWQELRGCVSNSVSAVPNTIRRSFPFIKRSV
jgi:hypothetical protein